MRGTRAGRWLQLAREWRLPRADRDAARAERRTERTLRQQRDSTETPERRRAAAEAEARRYSERSGWGL